MSKGIDVVRIPKTHGGGLMIRVDPTMAVEIIQSLTAQMISGSPNVGREEFRDRDGYYFSVSVHPSLDEKPRIVRRKARRQREAA